MNDEMTHPAEEGKEGGGVGLRPQQTDVLADERPVVRNPRGLFVEGTRPGPGRTPSGRRAALELIERLMSSAANQEHLYDAMQKSFTENPLRFYLRFIQPLLPRSLALDVGSGGDTASAVARVRAALGMPCAGGGS